MSNGSMLKLHTFLAKARLFLIASLVLAIAAFCANASLAQIVTGNATGGYDVPDPTYDAPATYYNSATGTGTTLRTNLHNIISSGFTSFSYGDSRTILPILWQDPANSSNMVLVYTNNSIAKPNPSGTSPAGLPGWDGGTTWNREHQWPQSFLGLSVDNSYKGAGSDLFELAPANPSVNSSRSNTFYGTSTSTGTYHNNGSPSTSFFPGDGEKGDVARSIFYMATRYYDGSGTPSINNLNIINGTTGSTYQIGDLQSLLHWNYEDGVNNFERRKNDLIYDNYQHNRNPFIDHPEYVWAVFGDSANSSQISVATPSSNGASSTTASLGNVIVGSSFGTSNVTVSKSGHTPTTFNITTGGNAITTGTGLLAGTGHPFDYDTQSQSMTVGLNASTGTAGAKTGTVTIHNSDISTSAGTGQGSADGDDVVTVAGNVYDHANASFASPSDTNSTTVNLGTYLVGSGTQTAGFNVYNLQNTAGFTAGLQYVSQSGSGSTSQLTNNLASAFTGTLAANSNVAGTASLNTGSAGNFSAAYTVTLSDDTSITGHTNQTVTLNLAGTARTNGTIYWNGASDSTWDLSHTKSNFTNLSTSDVYLQGDTVVFNDAQNPSGSRAVTLNTAITPASVTVNHSTGSDYTISGSGSIGGSASLTKSGSGKLTLSTNNTFSGGTTVSGGTLAVNHIHALGTGTLAINGGGNTTLQSGLSSAIVLPSLSIDAGSAAPTSTLDITNNKLRLTNASLGAATTVHNTITNQTQHAFDNFAWDQGGVTSSTVQNDVNNNNLLTAVGIMLNNDGGDGNLFEDLGGSTFGGQTTAVNDVLVRYTYLGDLNLDGVVDANDFNLFALGYSGGAPQVDWAWGDMDYSGNIDASDFNLFALGYSANVGLPTITEGAGGVQPVPEPSTLVLAALGLIGLGAFTRSRRTSASA